MIPESVTSIGEYAFAGCGSLTSVTIKNGSTDVGYGAFSNHGASLVIRAAAGSCVGRYAAENNIKFEAI